MVGQQPKAERRLLTSIAGRSPGVVIAGRQDEEPGQYLPTRRCICPLMPPALDGAWTYEAVLPNVRQILRFTDLQRICAPQGPPPRPVTVRRWADREGIRYKYDRQGGIWTTLDAVNVALGLVHQQHEDVREEDNI